MESAPAEPTPTHDNAPPPLEPTAWRRLAAGFGGLVLGGVLLVAAWAKILDPTAFAEQISREGLDFLLPASAVALFALALEVGLGSALVLGLRSRAVLWTSTALVAFFLFLTGRMYWRDLQGIAPEEASCGCFGNLVERTPAEAFWQDLVLLVVPLLLAFLVVSRPTGRPWTGRPWIRWTLVGLLTLAAPILAWKAPDLPLDNLATRLKPGIDPLALCAGQDAQRVCLSVVLPELADGEHLVVLADLDDAFAEQADALSEYHLAGVGPRLWVVTSADEETRFAFQFTAGPAFEIREAPPALLKPLYRTLPRSFRVADGEVRETWSGLPPLDRLAADG